MPPLFEELDYQKTPLGELVLRRRQSPAVPEGVVYEVKIDDEMLMSSSVTTGERALARLGLDVLEGRPCDVLIGGLGLGYSAGAALEYPNVRRLVVVELLAPVIDWHHRRLVPLADQLMDDDRCTLVEADFFAYVGPDGPAGCFDAILVDIDHAPDAWLHPRHEGFYSHAGLAHLAEHLHPGGVFALWSAAQPSEAFLDHVRAAFTDASSVAVEFHNPHVNEMDTNWIILARKGKGQPV